VVAVRRRVRARLVDAGSAREPEPSDVPRYIVCGDDPLTHRLVEELAVRYQLRVTVILPSRKRKHGPQIRRIPGVRIVERVRLDTEAFRAAGVESAVGLALAHQDDVGNLHAALRAQELNPDLRLVVRMFNMSLGHSIRRMLRHCRVLSDASIAAPAFVASALGEVAPSFVRLPGHTLYVARREDVAAADLITGLADTRDGANPDLLPLDEKRCDLVLAMANGASSPGDQLARAGRRSRMAHRLRAASPARLFGPRASRTLRLAALILFVVLVLGTALLAVIDRHLSIWNAAYVTVLNTVGGANADPRLPGAEKALEVVLALAGLAMVPVVTAAVVEAVVNARLALAMGRLRRPVAGHVVVVGLGNVGTRVIQQLRALGVPVVAIDKAETARGAQLARDLEVPLVIGDAGREETLREASVQTARALVVLSTDDVVNLEAALHARGVNPDIRVVLRLFDGDFADRVQRVFGITTSKSVSFLAAPAFASAMLEREVVGTIPIRRQVLLVAEVPVEAGSPLHGGTVAQAQHAGSVRVVGVGPAGPTWGVRWRPGPEHPLAADDRLIAVTTRDGLGRLLSQASADQPRRSREQPARLGGA
jgi:Trk K+ transport system NAD-binding subunit